MLEDARSLLVYHVASDPLYQIMEENEMKKWGDLTKSIFHPCENPLGWIIAIIAVLVLIFSGCSSITRFNKKTASGVMEFTKDSGETIEDYLISWPTYSGAIDGLPENIKSWLPLEFWKAKKVTDELSSMCISLDDALANPDKARCDFSDWQPDIAIPPEIYLKARMVANRIMVTTEIDCDLPYKGDKKNEYIRGYAFGISLRMANSVILNTLKGLAPLVPEFGDLFKLIPAIML